MRKTSEKKGTRILITIYPEHTQMLLKLVKGPHGFGSQSDVIRRAIVDEYLVFYKPYRSETAMGKIRQRHLNEVEEFESMPDKDYALKTFPSALFFTSAEGKEFLVFYRIANTVWIKPVEGIKDWVADDNQFEVNEYIRQLKEKGPLAPDYLDLATKAELRELGIVI